MRSSREIPAIRSALRANSPDEIAALRALPYDEYLLSAWWRARRNVALRDAGYQCARCKRTRDLQVHHVSYARLGAEEPSDLQVLCRDCHTGVHFDEAQMRIGVYLRIVSSVLAEGQLDDLTEIVEESKARCVQYAVPLHWREFQAAVSRLLSRMPRVPERYAELLAGRDDDPLPFTEPEAAALVSRLRAVGAIHRVPDAGKAYGSYVEALEDPDGRDEAAAHEAAVRAGRLDEYVQRWREQQAARIAEADAARVRPSMQHITDVLHELLQQRRALAATPKEIADE